MIRSALRRFGWVAGGGMLVLAAACGGSGYEVRVLHDEPVRSDSGKTVSARELKPYQRPYTVNGVRYDPLLDHRGYVEEGVASWYGADFHGFRTSNGEVYDMHAMTAAHKTLPLGVFVKVRNLSNNREAIVRVNDRGPFVKGRLIDLSFAAANTLGVAGPGTAPVRVEALGTQVRDAQGRVRYQPLPSYDIGSYAVQIGAFSEAENAQRLAAEMKTKVGAADVREGIIDGKRYFRVRAGHYRSLEEAEAARINFENMNYSGAFIVAFE